MRYLFVGFLTIILNSCSSDNLQSDLESINYSCCDNNPFADTNVDNLEQSRGELEFYGFATPNNDGVNDAWSIRNLELYENFTLKIFDVDKNLVYQANSNSESRVFFPQGSEFQDEDRVFQYELVIENETTFLNKGYFCLFTGMKKRSGGKCTSVFPDPILD
ncbi:gliding motility-associated C-terminal domain-containing protein [Maribacter sp. 2308TA10-17]|uniref:T9SS type B sorting domain-containing protein n=1 Tax=Maribacter sp. 2308TA10-17 TaxID=3386276 RepID=UPI0039BD4685